MQIDRIVEVELLEGLGHLLGGHRLDHLVAHRLVELGQAPGLKSSPRVEMKSAALLGAKQLDQVGEVGLVQRQREPAHLGRIALIERDNDGMQEIGANAALLVAQFDLACGVLHGLSVSPGC